MSCRHIARTASVRKACALPATQTSAISRCRNGFPRHLSRRLLRPPSHHRHRNVHLQEQQPEGSLQARIEYTARTLERSTLPTRKHDTQGGECVGTPASVCASPGHATVDIYHCPQPQPPPAHSRANREETRISDLLADTRTMTIPAS